MVLWLWKYNDDETYTCRISKQLVAMCAFSRQSFTNSHSIIYIIFMNTCAIRIIDRKEFTGDFEYKYTRNRSLDLFVDSFVDSNHNHNNAHQICIWGMMNEGSSMLSRCAEIELVELLWNCKTNKTPKKPTYFGIHMLGLVLIRLLRIKESSEICN